MPASAKVDRHRGIIYGRFQLHHDSYWGLNVALWLQKKDGGESVYLHFDENRPLYAVQVTPGRYQIAGFACFDRARGLTSREPFRSSHSAHTTFDVPPASEVYVGDYWGHATYDLMFERWGTDSFTNNFIGTTMDFREQYPQLATVPVTSAFH